MARKPQDNPQLDMTPMIDVVFELIIFFVVTLTEAQKKDETIELETGQHGVILTADEMPAERLQIDIASVRKDGKRYASKQDSKGNLASEARISIGDRTLTPSEITEIVKKRVDRYGPDFPIFIRADFETPHARVRDVMDACTAAGVWRLSFMAVGEDKTDGSLRPRLFGRKKGGE